MRVFEASGDGNGHGCANGKSEDSEARGTVGGGVGDEGRKGRKNEGARRNEGRKGTRERNLNVKRKEGGTRTHSSRPTYVCVENLVKSR